MTPKEFAAEMQDIKDNYAFDTEKCHSLADALMCQALNELAYGEGISIYESLERWCA
jgi:hypothetical protein